MSIKFIVKMIFIFFIPIIVFSQTNISTIDQNGVPTTKTEQKTNDIKDQLKAQEKLLKNVIEQINKEETVLTKKDKEKYINTITFLNNKIVINTKQKNILAVKRDELKLALLNENFIYKGTIQAIIDAKKSYKDKKYFIKLLTNNIELIKNIPLDDYTDLYEKVLNNKSEIAKEFVKNYETLTDHKYTHLYILEYLLNNMDTYRKTNFFIDQFNLEYFINQIDSIQPIAFISSLTSYYLKFTIGQITIVLFILLFFRLLNTQIVSIFTRFIEKLIIKYNENQIESIHKYIKKAIHSPLVYSLYMLAIQISIYILIKDNQTIQNITPWINTIYMAIFTWALYSILNLSIEIYANTLLTKYPNIRKEMIVFILRIIKIILVLLVLLFLFTQLGIDIKAIAASLGVGGIAIALASKDTLANFFGSLNIMTDNSFSQGDWIRTKDLEGIVVDIRMRTTRIRTFDNAMITVPNSELANTPIMNWSKRRIGRRIKMKLGITYESKMEDIINLKNDIFDMLSKHPKIASSKTISMTKTKKFEVTKREDLQGIKNTLLVYIDSFAPSSIDILIYCFSKSPQWEDWLETKEDVLIKIEDLVSKNNCSIAYPTQMVKLDKLS